MSFVRKAKQDFMEAATLNPDLKCFVTFQKMGRLPGFHFW